MIRRRGSLPHELLVSGIAALTVWATVATWQSLTVNAVEFIGPLFLCALVATLGGGTLRWLAVPAWLVALAQSLLLGAIVLSVATGSVLPTSDNLETFGAALRDGISSANRYQAPVPARAPSLAPFFVLVGAASMVLMDLLAVSRRMVATAGLLLLALYSVPIGFTVSGNHWWSFVVVAAGFLALLFFQQEEVTARWGRGVIGDESSSDPTAFGVRTGAVRSSALAIGAGTTAIAVALPALVPTLQLALWDGPGSGRNGDGISINNPLVDMRRDLSRGADIPLLRVSSEGQKPMYVRLSVLNRFNGEEWSTGDREVPSEQLAQGDMPPLMGVSSELNRTETLYQFSATSSLDSQWLPAMPLVTRIDVPGDWRYDRATMDFIAGDQSESVAGMAWSLRAVQLEYDLESLDAASSGASQVGSSLVQVPANMPGVVRSLAQSVAGSEPTRFRKARALQEWFRTEFDYSLDQVDSVGSSELAAFLDESDRSGYCEQFAAAMAIMSRMLDIPARVAVGFLEPTEIDPGMWEFSSHDLHAWPELYFPGSGWVRFEPTPAGRSGQVPDYTQGLLPEIEDTSRPGLPRASEELPNRGQSPAAAPEEAEESDEPGTALPVRGLLITLLALVLLPALLLAPRVLRARRRETRIREGSIEALWAELRDHCLDHGRPWPVGRSPRATAAQVEEWFGTSEPQERPGTGPDLNPSATASLGRLVEVLELSRYGRPGAIRATEKLWVRDLAKCTEAISCGVGPRRARRARWWPVSLVRQRDEGRPVRLTSSARSGEVDHVD